MHFLTPQAIEPDSKPGIVDAPTLRWDNVAVMPPSYHYELPR